ncbi:hypothetical protein RchiOBHm_Chr4g0391251 [Rosa chinensis]|uniref:Uncharacterized protein n=1 Tax=Rosa chinensis TaxID=74649 RepID=A0A2P6QQF4_ROSCH|nr:hypothetical protein RchiOBHm_Chr4g0391251 [Rosa chinensis]
MRSHFSVEAPSLILPSMKLLSLLEFQLTQGQFAFSHSNLVPAFWGF